MGKYFTVSELTRSSTAIQKKIDNTPPPDIKVKITGLINNLLDPVREKWGGPINVNSGFRCPVLNKAVGGAASSQHMTGEAADITAGSRAKNKRLFDMIRSGGFPFDQLIWEKGGSDGPDWVHVSYSSRNRRQVLHL